jgi:hypothetical protein
VLPNEVGVQLRVGPLLVVGLPLVVEGTELDDGVARCGERQQDLLPIGPIAWHFGLGGEEQIGSRLCWLRVLRPAAEVGQ